MTLATTATAAVAKPGLHLTMHAILVLAGLAVLFLVAYRVSLRLRPHVTCRKCRGTGKVRGVFFTWSRAWCPKCGGDGVVPRLGTCLLATPNRPHVAKGPIR